MPLPCPYLIPHPSSKQYLTAADLKHFLNCLFLLIFFIYLFFGGGGFLTAENEMDEHVFETGAHTIPKALEETMVCKEEASCVYWTN